MTVIVTGGAGYIGSHAVLAFQEAGYSVAVVDDLSTGRREAVSADVPFFEGDAGNRAFRLLPQQYRREPQPDRSLRRGRGTPLYLLLHLHRLRRRRAPAAHRGRADQSDQPLRPFEAHDRVDPGGHRSGPRHRLRVVALLQRGRGRSGGPDGPGDPQATQLVKVACEAVVGLRDGVTIFGEDYDTPDGTCVRDYIHVSDRADAHVAALDYLEAGGQSRVLNCGYGHSFSVREVLETVQEVAGRKLAIRPGPRRAGDPPALYAEVSQIRDALGWQPLRDDLPEIVADALQWEKLFQENRAYHLDFLPNQLLP